MTTVLLLATAAGFLVGRWLREEYERWLDWRAYQAFGWHGIASVEAPTSTEITAGVAAMWLRSDSPAEGRM